MADEVRSARQALGRGATSEALVHLWNAVEPARLAGDARRLGAIAGLAQGVRARGDEGEAREAERLLETLRSAVEQEGGLVPATGRLDADVHASGNVEGMYESMDEAMHTGGEESEEPSRGGRAGNLIWLALIVLIILFNVIGQLRDGGG